MRVRLTDAQWERIENILPSRVGHVGATAPDNRLFVDTVLHVIRTGCPWRDIPAECGYWQVVYNRFNRWCKTGVWERVFTA
jgi:transposase